jgi:hypothetical protein
MEHSTVGEKGAGRNGNQRANRNSRRQSRHERLGSNRRWQRGALAAAPCAAVKMHVKKMWGEGTRNEAKGSPAIQACSSRANF